jgi:hypothetical protein
MEANQAILIAASDIDPNAQTAIELNHLRRAMLSLATTSDYQIFGVCADSPAQARLALESYAKAFSYEIPAASGEVSLHSENPIYMKFNPRINRLYEDAYTGKFRGVLVSYHSDYADGHSGTYGHFPLDLFTDVT